MPAQITALPTPPSTNDPANFNTRADAFLGQMPTFVTQANAMAGEVASNTQAAAASATAATNKVAEATSKAAEASASAASALGAPGTNGTLTTSLTIGTGTKSFTTQAGKAWVAGQGFFIASSASPLNWMSGILTAYNATTGAAALQVDTVGGSGTFAAWNCGLAAGRPLPMASQAQAEAGADNATVMTPLATAQAVSAQAFPVGALLDSFNSPGSRWLPCNGMNYLNSAYPALTPLMPAYINPMTLRQAASSTGRGTFGGGIFVQWTYNGSVWQLWTSTDSVTWTLRTNPFGTSASPLFVSYMNGVFVAATHSTIYASPDGVSWISKLLPTITSITGIVYAFGLYILIGSPPSVAGGIWTSPDLYAWTSRTIPNSLFPYAVAYDASLGKVLVTGNGSWWVSSNGTVWDSLTGQPSMNATSVVSMGGKFFMTGNNSGTGTVVYATTTDVATWDISGTASATAVFGTVSAANNLFWDGARVFASRDAVLGCSVDGLTWTLMNSGVATNITSTMRSGPAFTTPTVIGAAAQGIRSGLDASTIQFTVPTIIGRASSFPCYIKAA